MHAGVGSNVVATDSLGGSNPIDFSGFEVVVEADIINNRLAPAPIETRVAAAQWDGDGRLVHHASCQGVHPIRNMLAAYYGLTHQQVRVTTADVGGSFGAKARLYPEEILLGHLSRLVGRPVRWTPSRSVDMVGLGHSRAQIQHVTIAGDRSGRIAALQAHVRVDAGAYPLAAMALALNTARMLPGPYDIAQVHWSVEAVVTNTTPIVAYRGAGRPESGALINRAVDLFAAEVGIDPVQVRRMNMITADQLPMTNPSGVGYDSGDYVEALEILVRELDLETLRREQADRRAAGATKLLGIGVACFIDRTAGVPGTEYGALQLKVDGGFRVLTGSSPYGQGHYTTWAQLVSERTGAPIEQIEVVHGDTDLVPRGGITGGSRSAQKAGSALVVATDMLVDQARQRAAEMLEAAVGDIVLSVETGQFHVAGTPGAASVGWAEIAAEVVAAADEERPGDFAFACEADYDTVAASVPYGAYGAVIELDLETGAVRLQRLVTVDDAGTIIHPEIVLGQVHGGAVQGIGQALFEEFVYDDAGNPLTGDFLTYTVPSAVEFPMIETHLTVHPSPNNLLGAKGIAESGTIGATPAVQNAVVDAVAHLGIGHIDMPLTPQRVWRSIEAVGGGSGI